jgi:hypothetical protein
MNSTATDSQVKSQMLSYLEQKYGEPFGLEQFSPAGTGFTREEYDSGYAYPESDPSAKFEVQRRETADGAYTFADGYPFVLAERQLTPEMESLARAQFGDAKASVAMGSPTGVSRYDYLGSFNLADFIAAERGVGFAVKLFVAAGDVDPKVEAQKVEAFGKAVLDKRHPTKATVPVDVFYVAPDSLQDLDAEAYAKLDFRRTAQAVEATHTTFTELQDGKQVYSVDGIVDNFDLAN